MNSRQRRGVILLVLSALCALAAFAGVLSVIRDVNAKVGPEVTAYRLKDDIAPYKELSAGQFEKITMPERWLSGTAVTDLSEIRGKIAVTQLRRGSLLQSDMIVDRPELESGQQEIAILIDASTGVAGKINPGSRVNIYATFEEKDSDSGKDTSKLMVADARVIDVGRLTPSNPVSRAATAGARRPRPSRSPSRSTPPTPSASRTPSRSPSTSVSPSSGAARPPSSYRTTVRTPSTRTSRRPRDEVGPERPHGDASNGGASNAAAGGRAAGGHAQGVRRTRVPWAASAPRVPREPCWCEAAEPRTSATGTRIRR